MKLHLIWDMDGTLVNSEPEILVTLQKSLQSIGLSMSKANSPLRIGPPLPIMLRTSFTEDVLSNKQIEDVIEGFRKIYDKSEFEETLPFEGIDEIIKTGDYVHHVITNKPDYATRRIIEKKGWSRYVVDVLSPNTLMEETGRQMKKQELFQYFRSNNQDIKVVGIGDMAVDAVCARASGIPAIGVLWGTGTKCELEEAGCDAVVENAEELIIALEKFIHE